MSGIKYIHTSEAPEAIGPYSQAVRIGTMLYTSGQIPLDPQSGQIVGDTITQQTQQVFENLKAVLAEAGSSLQNIIKTTVFITDMSTFGQLNEIYAQHMGTHRPARSTVEVKGLPKGVLVEIEAIAQLPEN